MNWAHESQNSYFPWKLEEITVTWSFVAAKQIFTTLWKCNRVEKAFKTFRGQFI